MDLTELPPPPNAENDPRQQQQGQGPGGLFLPFQQIQGIARMWVNYRGLIGWGAKLARQKIPKELDEALAAIATTGDPQALQLLQGQQGPQGQMPSGQWSQPNYGPEDMPENEPGTPVLTHSLAEEAYYLHTVKGMGVRQIAAEFTNRGNPVSKATVSRYIDDIEEEIDSERGQRFKRAASGGLVVLAWLGSAFLFNILLRFFNII